MDFMWAADGAAHAGAAKRRTEWCLRAYLRYARMSVAMALAENNHHSAPRRPTMARARGEESDEMNYAMGLTTPPPTAANTVYFSLDDDEDVHSARPTPHRGCGSGFQLVLDVTVPPLGGGLVEVPNVVSQVVEWNVDIPVHGVWCMRCLFPSSRSPAPVVESIAAAPALVFIAGGVSCTRASGVLFASACGGVFCTRARSCSCDKAFGGVYGTRALSVSSTRASGRVFCTRANGGDYCTRANGVRIASARF